MSLGRLAVADIAAVDTDELLFTTTVSSTVDLTACNRNAAPVNVRVALVDGGLVDLADEDYVFYDFSLSANESQSLLIKEPLSAGESVIIYSDTLGVSFRLSGEGA